MTCFLKKGANIQGQSGTAPVDAVEGRSLVRLRNRVRTGNGKLKNGAFYGRHCVSSVDIAFSQLYVELVRSGKNPEH